MPVPLRARAQQAAWAAGRGISADRRGYVLLVLDNLVHPMSDLTRSDFDKADGNELRDSARADGRGRAAKMRALHSSSALAYNVFEFWRFLNRRPLADALGIEAEITDVSFEQKFPTGVGPRSPNLDVVFSLSTGGYVAVESKFTEHHHVKLQKLARRYFASGPLWRQAGLPRCQEIADGVGSTANGGRSHFDVAQLLKHALGIAGRTQGSLLYVYYEAPGDSGAQHAREVAHFAARCDASLGFRAVSYQQFFSALRVPDEREAVAYRAYLAGRYFPGS